MAEWSNAARAQFAGLPLQQPWRWPWLPRALLCLLAALLAAACLWLAWLDEYPAVLAAEQAREAALRQAYRAKLVKAADLNAMKRQREQIQRHVAQLEKQLPNKAEMAALLSDVNQAGLGRGLQFEVFRPGQVRVKDYYAELPITVRVVGHYHDIGGFVSDVAHLSRIVTLNDLTLTPGRDGNLVMDVTARTFRDLDAQEEAAQETARHAAAAGGRK